MLKPNAPKCPNAQMQNAMLNHQRQKLYASCPLNGTLLDTTLAQALLDTQSDASGDGSPDLLNILSGNALPKGSSDDIVAQGKGLIGNLASTEVFGSKGCDKGSRLAVWVVLDVHGTLGEDGHHVGGQFGADDAALAVLVEHAVLGNHLSHETAGGDDLELGGARMDVKSVHAAS